MLPSESTSSRCATEASRSHDHLSSAATSSTSLATQESSQCGSRPWYHGQMTQAEAIGALDGGRPGLFLLWRQTSSKYYISCISTVHEILHLPIRQMSGKFYFMGKQFLSLPEVVEYYQISKVPECGEAQALRNSDTVGPSVSHSSCSTSYTSEFDGVEEKRIVIYQYDGLPENAELICSRGDIITELNRSEDDWIWGRNDVTGQQGYIPLENTIRLRSPSSHFSDIPYYHDTMDWEEISTRMAKSIKGSFFLRPSSKGSQACALMVNMGEHRVEKFLIEAGKDDKGGFFLSGRRFPAVEHIIERYCSHSIRGDCRLRRAMLRDEERRDSLPEHLETARITRDEWPPIDLGQDALQDLQNHNVASHTVATVQALRKSREDKAWKSCWTTLSDDPNGGCELFVSESENSMKPRFTLDLAYCHMYSLDESIFSKDGCVYFAPTDINVQSVYICFKPTTVFIEWMQLLRPRTLGLPLGAVPVMVGLRFEAPKVSHIALLSLNIEKYKSGSLKDEYLYSAVGLVNGVKICTTNQKPPVRTGSDTVVFDAAFLVPCVPTEKGSLQISCFAHLHPKKPRSCGHSRLHSLESTCAETAQSVIDPTTSPSGDICFTFKASRSRIRVLEPMDYQPFLQMLDNDPYETLELFSDAMNYQQRILFCTSLIAMLLPTKMCLLKMIGGLLRRVLFLSTENAVLRKDSLATTMLTQVLRIACRSRLEDSLDVLGIYAAAVNDKKLPTSGDILNVINSLDELVREGTLAHDIMCVVAKMAEERFPSSTEEHIVKRVLSAVFMLRFVNPILVNYFQGTCVNKEIARSVQTAANNATSMKCEDAPTAVMKNLFDRLIRAHRSMVLDTSASPEIPLCADWPALICHLLLISMRDNGPTLSTALVQLLRQHAANM